MTRQKGFGPYSYYIKKGFFSELIKIKVQFFCGKKVTILRWGIETMNLSKQGNLHTKEKIMAKNRNNRNYRCYKEI